MPKISIIIPAYNAEKTIENCVKSILCGSFSDIEVLVIDDGSADLTAKTAENLSKTDSRVRVILQKNGGVSLARNNGISNALGQYIMFCDADDTYASNMCAELYGSITKNKSDIAVGGYREIRNKSSVIMLPPIKTPCMGDNIFNECILPIVFSGTNGFMGTVCTSIFKKSIITENNLQFCNKISIAEDMLFLTQYLLCCKKLSTVRKVLYEYRLCDGSATKKYSSSLKQNSELLESELKKAVINANRPYTDEMCAKRSISTVIMLQVNEARRGNPNSFFKQIKNAVGFCKGCDKSVKTLVADTKALKLKRIIALNSFFGVMFFVLRRVQRVFGVYF